MLVRQVFSGANTEYEPSIREDISEMLPFATDQTEESFLKITMQISSCSRPGNRFQTGRLRCLGNLGFGTSFWIHQFLRLTCLPKGEKTMPFHAEALQPENKEDPVEKRVMARQTLEVSGFLQYIKDVPERTWREEREATWETAIRRWILLIEQWRQKMCPCWRPYTARTRLWKELRF